MKYFAAILGLLIWGIFTIILICTILGLLVIGDEAYLDIPHKLLKVFDEKSETDKM